MSFNLPLFISHSGLYVALATIALLFLVLYNLRLMIQDYLVIDWLILCTITPKGFVIPGSEGHPAYKDYAFHFRGFLIGTVFSAVMGLIVAIIG